MTSHCHFTVRVRVEARRDPNDVGAHRVGTGKSRQATSAHDGLGKESPC